MTSLPSVMTLTSRYVMVSASKAFALVAIALTGLFSLLEFVEQLASVGQGHFDVTDAFVYVLLTVPSRLLQVAPMSMLLGSLVALGDLARHSELTAMLSLGVSQRRIIGSVLILTLPIVAFLLLVEEFVIPPAQQLAQSQRSSALVSSTSSDDQDSFWAHSDRQYLNVQHFGPKNLAIGIDIYAFAPDGSLKSIIHADHADIRRDGIWLLTGVSRKRVASSQMVTDRLASLSWHSFIPFQQMQFMTLPLESIPPIALYRHVRDLDRQHQRTTRYSHELWAKISIPLSMIAMIMIAAPFVFGSNRLTSTGRSLAFGIGFGIVFSLGQQILERLGLLLELNPALAALTPSLLVIALAFYRLQHVRGRRRTRSFTSAYPVS